jgi:hypothetical protein
VVRRVAQRRDLAGEVQAQQHDRLLLRAAEHRPASSLI